MKPVVIVAGALALPLAATSAWAMDNLILVDLSWVQAAPGVEEVVAAWPAAARAKGLGGLVTLNCQFDRQGKLGQCEVVSEAPRGAGFGKAALSLTDRFHGPATLPGGHTIFGTHAEFSVRFAPDMLTTANITAPEWVSLPTAAQFQGAFPEAAAKAGVLKARAAMSCKVGPDGGLSACAAASEDPAGYGFGDQTLTLAPLFRVKLWGADGRPVVGGTVRVPIRYDLQQASQPKS